MIPSEDLTYASNRTSCYDREIMDEKYADDRSECYRVNLNNQNVFMLKEITNCKHLLLFYIFSAQE